MSAGRARVGPGARRSLRRERIEDGSAGRRSLNVVRARPMSRHLHRCVYLGLALASCGGSDTGTNTPGAGEGSSNPPGASTGAPGSSGGNGAGNGSGNGPGSGADIGNGWKLVWSDEFDGATID